jgi:hypothetical protein
MSKDFWSDSKRRVPSDKSCPAINGTTDDSLHTTDDLHGLVRSQFIHRWATIRGCTAQISVVFKDFYSDRIETAKCAICHPVTKKTERSEYGTAVEEALGKKNVKDDDAIKKALKKAEGKLPKDGH